MNRFLLWIILYVFSYYAQAQIHTKVDPSQIEIGSLFKLILTQEDPQDVSLPDLTVLQNNFFILGTERHVNYSIIDGQTHSSSEYIVTLKAKKAGQITIPALTFGNEQSKPFTIDVRTQSNSPTQEASDSDLEDSILLSTKVNETQPYISQQVTYTVSLYNSKHLFDAEYQGPQVKDALLFPLGDTKRYQTTKNNKTYLVEEQNYAVFPQKSGSLKIKSPIFTALIYDVDTRRIKAQDKPIQLTVLPIPKQYSSNTWLPAKKMTLSEHYENTSQSLSQGSTLTRIINIEGLGVPAQLLPPLQFNDNQEFSIYPEKGAQKNQIKQGELVGSSEIKITYLLKKAGTITLPSISLPWFNTTTQQQESAVLAPRSIDVLPNPTTHIASTPQVKTQKISARLDPKASHIIREQDKTHRHLSWGWAFAIVFAIAWFITLLLWGWQKWSSRPLGKRQSKNIIKALNQACMEKDSQAARQYLLNWAHFHWPDTDIFTLNDIIEQANTSALKKQTLILSQILYGSKSNTQWQGFDLYQSLCLEMKSKKPIKQIKTGLPPINPES